MIRRKERSEWELYTRIKKKNGQFSDFPWHLRLFTIWLLLTCLDFSICLPSGNLPFQTNWPNAIFSWFNLYISPHLLLSLKSRGVLQSVHLDDGPSLNRDLAKGIFSSFFQLKPNRSLQTHFKFKISLKNLPCQLF